MTPRCLSLNTLGLSCKSMSMVLIRFRAYNRTGLTEWPTQVKVTDKVSQNWIKIFFLLNEERPQRGSTLPLRRVVGFLHFFLPCASGFLPNIARWHFLKVKNDRIRTSSTMYIVSKTQGAMNFSVWLMT